MKTRKTILLFGAGGMLGHKLAQVLSEDDDLTVVCLTRRPLDARFVAPRAQYIADMDVLNGADPIKALLSRVRPDVVINAIGAVKQRDIASAVDATFYLNGTLPHLLALLNPNPNGQVIHFSTDCVFVGDRGMYHDTDLPDALDLYGRSKACGELQYGRHLTLRTSIIGFEISTHLSLLSWLFRQPKGATLRGFTDAIFSGLPTTVLAQTVQHLIHRDVPLAGLYNVASDPISKYDLLTRLNAAFELGLHIDPDRSLAIDRSLDDGAFRQVTQTTRPAWDALISKVVTDYNSLPYDQLYRPLTQAIS